MNMYNSKKTDNASSEIIPIGISIEDVEPVSHNFTELNHMLIVGNNRDRLARCVKAIVEILGSRTSGSLMSINIFDSGAGALSSLASNNEMIKYASHLDETIQLAQTVCDEVDCLRRLKSGKIQSDEASLIKKQIYFIIEDYSGFKQAIPAELATAIEDFIRRESNLGIHIIMAGLTTDLVRGIMSVITAQFE
jgi:hypothetical protein